MEIEFKQYIHKRYNASISSLYKNTILIGQIIDIDTTTMLDKLDELDILLRIKKQPTKIDDMDMEWLNIQQKERLNLLKSKDVKHV